MKKLYQVVSIVADGCCWIEYALHWGFNFKEAEESYQSEKALNQSKKKKYPSRIKLIVELRIYEVEEDFNVEDGNATENLICYGDYKTYKQFEY